MSERNAFLRALRAAPADETRRLVFADWLEEHGDPLGEFIRVQCALEPLRDRYHDERVEELRRREERLLKEHRAEWLGPLDELAGDWPHLPAHSGFRFRRGLVERVHLPVQTFLERGAELAEWCPALHEATLFQLRGRGLDLAYSPHLAGVTRLVVADWLTDADARALAASPHLGGLRALEVWLGGRDEEAVCRAFAGSPALRGLREVQLVQLRGGLEMRDRATKLAARADRLAAEVNRWRGQGIARVGRPFERLFPLHEDVGHDFHARRLPGGRQGLVAAWAGDRGEDLLLEVFDAQGRFLEEHRRGPICRLLARRPKDWYAVGRDELLGYLRHEFGFEPAPIHVKEFATEDELSVYLLPRSYAAELENLDEIAPHSGEEEWRELGTRVHRWLEGGDFVVDWGNDYWAGPDGEIHSS